MAPSPHFHLGLCSPSRFLDSLGNKELVVDTDPCKAMQGLERPPMHRKAPAAGNKPETGFWKDSSLFRLVGAGRCAVLAFKPYPRVVTEVLIEAKH